MNLHRTTNKPDWENTKPSDYNIAQKIAAATHGIVTPANLITVAGLALVVYGLIAILDQHYWIGLMSLAVGRLLDIADGAAAQASGTKSPLGEFLDAAVDKIGTLLTVIVLYVGQIGPWWLVTIILVPQVIIPFVILYKQRRKIKVHPTRIGKLSMAATWVAISAFLLVKATAISPAIGIDSVLYAVSVVAFCLGAYALWQYATGRDETLNRVVFKA